MLVHTFLVVVAVTERTRHPPSGLIVLTCTKFQHLFATLLARPPVTSATDCAGRSGDADMKPRPHLLLPQERMTSNYDSPILIG